MTLVYCSTMTLKASRTGILGADSRNSISSVVPRLSNSWILIIWLYIALDTRAVPNVYLTEGEGDGIKGKE